MFVAYMPVYIHKGVHVPNDGIVIPNLLMHEGMKEEVNTFFCAHFVFLSRIRRKFIYPHTKQKEFAHFDLRIIFSSIKYGSVEFFVTEIFSLYINLSYGGRGIREAK